MSLKILSVCAVLIVAVPAARPQGVAKVSGAPSPDGFAGSRAEPIKDPSLNNMTAWIVIVPEKWRFEGTLYQGGPCGPAPNPVYRLLTPDGMGYVEAMPALSWRWGSGPANVLKYTGDCLAMKDGMTGQELLDRLAGILTVHYGGPAPVPDAVNAEQKANLQKTRTQLAPMYAAEGLQQPTDTVELSRAYVSNKNGTFAMKGRIDLAVFCSVEQVPGEWTLSPEQPGHPAQMVKGAESTVEGCHAFIQYLTAPADRFDAMASQWDTHGMGVQKPEDAYLKALIERSKAEMKAGPNGTIEMLRDSTARQRQFKHNEAVHGRIIGSFGQTPTRSFSEYRDGTIDVVDFHTVWTWDWVDYALDERIVVDPNTGELTEVSHPEVTAWSNTNGDEFTSEDPAWNPKQVLPGTWTHQAAVHGDGVPQ
jgi:hypothetical protein